MFINPSQYTGIENQIDKFQKKLKKETEMAKLAKDHQLEIHRELRSFKDSCIVDAEYKMREKDRSK